jgi:hypothetical protein
MQIYEKTHAASQMDHENFVLGEDCVKALAPKVCLPDLEFAAAC